MKDIGVGIIGTGFMGKSHANAYRAVRGVFPDCPQPQLRTIADIDETAAEQTACHFGFDGWTSDWRTLLDDKSVGLIAITSPNKLHREMALAAIAAGKYVHCEKPLAPSAREAEEMMAAAEASGRVTQCGFNYIKNPLLALARDMVASGELGEITGFRGIHAEDYMADPDGPYTWRLDPSGGAGAIADIGSHIICTARFLVGPISEINADLETIVKSRPVGPGARKAVEVDDTARMLVRFARGCGGTLEATWSATGRKMQHAFELTGTKGSLAFTQERLNELHYYNTGCDPRHNGYVRIEAGPQHKPYGNFCVAAGHQLGFNDLKIIEVADFLGAIASSQMRGPDFREAWEIQKVIDTAVQSSKARAWLKIT